MKQPEVRNNRYKVGDWLSPRSDQAAEREHRNPFLRGHLLKFLSCPRAIAVASVWP